ncbi:MAG: hypothetical protein ACLQPH_16635 [Acidimicrobiales bacterium]
MPGYLHHMVSSSIAPITHPRLLDGPDGTAIGLRCRRGRMRTVGLQFAYGSIRHQQ